MQFQAKPLMIQGTMSNVGKSLITAALCRIFTRDGFKVSPFKSQNMALNSFITPDGLEIGRAQAAQCEAAGKDADARTNPILLKPTGEGFSQVILNGEVYADMKAPDYFKARKSFIPKVLEAYESLAAENDIIVIEGAGSPAEINLNKDDIVNMGLAEIVNSPVILAADIDRGGVFASLYGTVALLPQYKKYFKGALINKFIGDISLILPALKSFEEKIGMEVLGVLPYTDINFDPEDSLNLPGEKPLGKSEIDIAVIRLPHISNFTDFSPLELWEGTSLRYISSVEQLAGADLLIIPGTKNTIEDALYMKEKGFYKAVEAFASSGGPVIGICGGYQILCKKISDPQGFEGGGSIEGAGLLEAETVFSPAKIRTRVSGIFRNAEGFFSFLNGKTFEGYEVHMGKTYSNLTPTALLKENNGEEKRDGISRGNVLGLYVHGLFDSAGISGSLINRLRASKGLYPVKAPFENYNGYKNAEYDKLADMVRKGADIKKIYEIIAKGV